jgi:hypothetical protein
MVGHRPQYKDSSCLASGLKVTLQGLGHSGRLNTAFIERVNLTVHHAIAALARRSWATSQQASQLLAHLEWWRAYYHGCRVLTKHYEWRWTNIVHVYHTMPNELFYQIFSFVGRLYGKSQ